MKQALIILGGICRSSERRVSCRCGYWVEVGGEEVEEVWFPEVPGFRCEECGERVDCSEENSEEGSVEKLQERRHDRG